MSHTKDNDKLKKTSTTKGLVRGGQSYPMASFLIKGELRPHVGAFFSFARELDDLADNPDIMPGDKMSRLNSIEQVLRGELGGPDYDISLRMSASLKVTGVNPQHCFDMIEAAKQDVNKTRYENWSQLLEYCQLSAAPIGRYLLDLYGENKKIYPLTDALCSALQIINHIQDCREDCINLDRVYIPQDILDAQGVSLVEFEETTCSPTLRLVLNDCLDRVEAELESSITLPRELSSKSLGMETAVIIKVAKKLIKGLRKKDPLSGPIMLNRFQYMSAGFRGVFSFPTV